jgi:quinol monooxygenase YgiN
MCQDVLKYSKEQMADRSNGILAFEISQDPWDKQVFHFWERYETNIQLGRHNSSTKMSAFMENVGAFDGSLSLSSVSVHLRSLVAARAEVAPVAWADKTMVTWCCTANIHPTILSPQCRSSNTWKGPLVWHSMTGRMGSWAKCACKAVSAASCS